MPSRIFGHLPSVTVGTAFDNRAALAAAGVHRPMMAGISGTPEEGADSIVLSGGYEDDTDDGEVIVYTGHGGNDPGSKKQVADQTMTKGNLALAHSAAVGLPIRVSRGSGHRSPYSPAAGYRYDGLFYVEDYWQERGRSGFVILRFRLRRADELSQHLMAPQPDLVTEEPNTYTVPSRSSVTIQRIVRSTSISNTVKEKHDYTCQVCCIRLETAGGAYAECAHIRPLGQPHNGPDIENNILCLCPNHHVLFDYGAFTINDDLTLSGLKGHLRTHPEHHINSEHLAYRRDHYLTTL